MTDINFLQLGPYIHCLRCHKNIPAEEFMKHTQFICPYKDSAPTPDYCKEHCTKGAL